MHSIEMTFVTFKQLMDIPNKVWGNEAPDFLEHVSRRLERESREKGLEDIHASELRRLAALLRKAKIYSEGGAPIDVICQHCKILYDARPGGEPYPEGKRISHGACPPCMKLERDRLGLSEKEDGNAGD